jgi:putative NADH-flavin reductase
MPRVYLNMVGGLQFGDPRFEVVAASRKNHFLRATNAQEDSMKLLIVGATGKIGSELVKQALDRGFEVTALVRSLHKVKIEDDRLTVVTGSPLDEEILKKAVTGCDAVLSALGHLDLKKSYLVTEAARTVIEAMKTNNVMRFMILSSTLVAPGGSFMTKIPRYLTRHALNDSAEMEKVVRRASLAWTIVRLVRLTNSPAAPYRIFEDEPPALSPSISRASVAACMLDLVSDQSYFQKNHWNLRFTLIH